MNRNAAIAIGLGVLALFVSAILFGPTVVEVIDDILTPEDEMSMLIEFHDEDGNLIDVAMAITAGGIEVTSMTVTASWTVEGENIEPDTFNIHGVIKIDKEDLSKDQPVYIPLDSWSFDSGEMVGAESHTWILADLLPMEDQDIGWLLSIRAVFTPTATDTDGNAIEPGSSTTTRISTSLKWMDDPDPTVPGILNLVQCAVTKAYPP